MHNRSGIILIICHLPSVILILYALLVFLLMKLFYYVFMVFIDNFITSIWFLLISDFVRVVFSLMKITKNTFKIASFPIFSTLTLSRLYLFSLMKIQVLLHFHIFSTLTLSRFYLFSSMKIPSIFFILLGIKLLLTYFHYI